MLYLIIPKEVIKVKTKINNISLNDIIFYTPCNHYIKQWLLNQALINLESVDAPAGEMKVVLGPGWPGILLHEAIGHGLEGDLIEKKLQHSQI